MTQRCYFLNKAKQGTISKIKISSIIAYTFLRKKISVESFYIHEISYSENHILLNFYFNIVSIFLLHFCCKVLASHVCFDHLFFCCFPGSNLWRCILTENKCPDIGILLHLAFDCTHLLAVNRETTVLCVRNFMVWLVLVKYIKPTINTKLKCICYVFLLEITVSITITQRL